MLILILKKLGVPDSRMREVLEKLTRIKTIASAVFYTAMVFIVIFGISQGVYAGFPKFAPYLIIAVFLFMAFLRMYQCIVDDGQIRKNVEKQLEESEKKRMKKAADEAKTGLISDAAAEQTETDDSAAE
jgi:hypothetical protein